MKLLLSLIFAASVFAQTTALSPVIVMKTTHVQSWQAFIVAHLSGFSGTMASGVLATDTTITLTSATDAANCTPTVLIADAPVGNLCSMRIESEAVTVTAVSGAVLTVTRGMLGTTAAPHVAGLAVNFLQYRTIFQLMSATLARLGQQILEANPPAAISTQQAAIKAAQLAITTEQKASIQ